MIENERMENDYFGQLISELIPGAFGEFRQENEELSEFLVSVMVQLCKHQKEGKFLREDD
jgi:hypothetical protein